MPTVDSGIELIRPDWPAPANVQAFSTTRTGGVSRPPFDSLNLAAHVGDAPRSVEANRRLLARYACLPSEPQWLAQCHGNTVVRLPVGGNPRADAATTVQPDVVCAVLTADCLPLLLCNRDGTQVAAIHAGWKGLCAGVIGNTLAQFDCTPDQILVWLGPAISQPVFEVGADVYQAFCDRHADNAGAFQQTDAQHWLCDLYQLARLELQSYAVHAIYGGEYCTFDQARCFYSYRREHPTGRIASLIWF